MIYVVAAPYIGFPSGMAATSRVTAYARGLVAAGADVKVILLGPSEIDASTAENTAVSGVHQGIPFEYTSVSTLKSRSFITRQWRMILSPLKAQREILRAARDGGVEAVLVYSRSEATIRYFAHVCKRAGAILAVDLAEMPYYSLEAGPTRDAKQIHFGERSLAQADLVIAISRYLADYASAHLRAGARAIMLPIMVDCDEYSSEAMPAHLPRRITYAGILNEKKDGVATLMRVFAGLAPEYPDVVLRLVGDSYDPLGASNLPEFGRLAKNLGISSRVEFVGHVPRTDIPRYLADSSVLVLARPSSQQADAGFPTKVGEYLASGRPVVVTRTSDISEYLADRVSAYLAEPDDPDSLERAIRRALADPSEAKSVGLAGRKVAAQFFDYRKAGDKLLDAIKRQQLGR